jgi:flagellar protein FliO/FliZ
MTWLVAQADVVGAVGPDLVPSLARTFGALMIVLSLIGALAWLVRRGVIAKKSGKGLGIEAALPLGERRSLVVVTVEGRRLLVGLAPNAVTLVTELDRPASFDRALTAAPAGDTRPA